jgi:twitching motility protein PilU
LAAMLGHRNNNAAGHIITIEDPIEFVHPHKKSIVTQREVGVDTQSWENALKNTLRQAPNVILVGEVRTRETMEYAINFAETGHLVLCTLHANSSNQALDRIINFFDEAKREQLLMDLSLNLRALLSQRLVRKEGGGRCAAMEILLNTPHVADMIFKGKVGELKEVMSRGNEQGMITFDQSLFKLFESGEIDYAEALRHADSQNELRLNIKLNSKRARQNLDDDAGVNSLSVHDDEEDEEANDEGLFPHER